MIKEQYTDHLESNKLIAKFMGIKARKKFLGWVLEDGEGNELADEFTQKAAWSWFLVRQKCYHNSWEMLMEVVNRLRIQGCFVQINSFPNLTIGWTCNQCTITLRDGNVIKRQVYIQRDNLRDCIYDCIVKYLNLSDSGEDNE